MSNIWDLRSLHLVNQTSTSVHSDWFFYRYFSTIPFETKLFLYGFWKYKINDLFIESRKEAVEPILISRKNPLKRDNPLI